MFFEIVRAASPFQNQDTVNGQLDQLQYNIIFAFQRAQVTFHEDIPQFPLWQSLTTFTLSVGSVYECPVFKLFTMILQVLPKGI